MPLVYQQNINATAKLAIWHIEENEAFFLNEVSLLSEIHHPRKRLQHLAGRYMLQILHPGFPLENIRFSVTNKPFLPGDPLHFSISHCGEYAAVIISDSCRVGIDVEHITPKILRVMHKFLSNAERKIFNDCSEEEAATIAWTCKEAVFKWYGTGSVDFIKHITLTSFSFSQNQFLIGCTFSKGEPMQLYIKGSFMDSLCMAWVIAR